jgi:site-specific DNA-adenine methylase
MRYLGGKCRQSKEIVNAIRRLRPDFKVYVEPFCGAMWSACAIIRAFPGRKYLLSDNNPYLMTTWIRARNGWDPPPVFSEAEYMDYKKRLPVYLDPPYEGRTHQYKGSKGFDYDHFRNWAEALSKRCCVLTTEFVNPRGWEVLHNWGDTVVRHHSGGESDGTCELLMRVRSKST